MGFMDRLCYDCKNTQKLVDDFPCNHCSGTPDKPHWVGHDVTMTVIGRFLMVAYCHELIGRKAEFSVRPINNASDDEWQVTVTSDNADIFEKDFPEKWA